MCNYKLFAWVMVAVFNIAAAGFVEVYANTLEVQVLNQEGKPLENAVVYLLPSQKTNNQPAAAKIEQQGRKFIPMLTVLQRGGEISFPNLDKVRHHVYSFSTPKKFELKLYSGTPANPVQFDHPGTVVIGCNIHDFMLAYIHVVDTPYFTKSGLDGKASIPELPSDQYTLKVWHYSMSSDEEIASKTIRIPENMRHEVSLKLSNTEVPHHH